jgi:hypothetical protein
VEKELIRQVVKSPYFWILPVALLVTLPLIVLTFKSARAVEIYTVPESEDGAKVGCKFVLTRAYNGPAAFEFCAELVDSNVEKVVLKIRPIESAQYYDQGVWRVEKGHVRGVAQLGSEGWPVKDDADYSFRLVVADDDRTLANGKIIAKVNELVIHPGWLVFVIGLLASVVQIGQATVMGLWRESSSQQSERSP